MTRSPTPPHDNGSSRLSAVRSVLKVSGTVTVLVVANLSRPASTHAQAIGTMQVVAQVTPAGTAWDGLAAAQQAAREFAAAPASEAGRRTDHSLIQIELETTSPAPGSRPRLAISIQHLRN